MELSEAGILDERRRAAVEAELARILNSSPFRASKRSAKLLAYVVERSLDGRFEELKERTIGVHLFGRPPDYRTDEDASVRVAAGEIRKRLAQFYLESGANVVRIDLPAGSYVPAFQFITEPLPPRQAKARRWWRLAAGAAAALSALGLSLLYFQTVRPSDPATEFWAPVFASKQRILVALGELAAYDLVGPALQDYEELRASGCPPADPRCRMRIKGLERIHAGLIPTGDAAALAALLEFFLQRGQSYAVKWVGETHFSELRREPTVLIGAGLNRWAELMRGQVRYAFGMIPDGRFGIWDSHNPQGSSWSLASPWPRLQNQKDYGVISRWRDSGTGVVMVCVAGISPFGTRAAGELITNPQLLRAALAGKKVDFTKPTVQLVFQTRIVEDAIAQTQVLVTHAE